MTAAGVGPRQKRNFMHLRWICWSALLLVAGAGAALGQGNKKAPRARPVVVAPVKVVSEAPTFKASGLLSPVDKALLSVDVPGRVVAIRKRDGELVTKGDVLAELENTGLKLELAVQRARLKETEARLALSRQKVARAKALYEQKLDSAERYENESAASAVIEAQLGSAQAQIERLISQIKMLVVRAPISGQIVKASLEIGQWITSNNPIYEIFNYNRFEVRVGLPGKFLTTIPVGAPVAISIPELEQKLGGTIQTVIRHVENSSGNFVLRIQVENPKGVSLSGLLAQVEVPVGRAARVITVPRDAIVRRGGKTQVVVVRKGVAQIVPVTIKGNFGNGAVIIRGGALKPKEQVVVRGNERLKPGTAVRVTGTL